MAARGDIKYVHNRTITLIYVSLEVWDVLGDVSRTGLWKKCAWGVRASTSVSSLAGLTSAGLIL